MPIRTTAAAQNAARASWGRPDNADSRVTALAEHVRKVVDSLPPLTPEQYDRIDAILRPAVNRVARRRDVAGSPRTEVSSE